MPGVPPIDSGDLPPLASEPFPATSTGVKVQPGDTWQIFADANGVDVSDLMVQNHVDPTTDPGHAIPFQSLTLPTCGYGETTSAQSFRSGLPPAPPYPEAESAMKATLKSKMHSGGVQTAGATVPGGAAAGASVMMGSKGSSLDWARTARPEELARTARPEELAATQAGAAPAGTTQADGLAGRASSGSAPAKSAVNLGETGAAGPDTKAPLKSSPPSTSEAGESVQTAEDVWLSGPSAPPNPNVQVKEISVEEALSKAKANPEQVLPRGDMSQQWAWRKVEGQAGEAPAAFEVNDGIHPPQISINYDRLSPKDLEALKSARADTAAARAARGGAKVGADGGRAVEEGGSEAGKAADAAKNSTKKGMGVGDTVAERAGKGVEAAEKGGAKVANRVTQKGVGAVGEGTTVASEAGVAAEEGAVKLGGRLAIGMEALGFIGFMLEPLEMLKNFAGSYEEARNALKHRGYIDGFSQGVAAAMKGVPQDEVRPKLGMETNAPDMTHKVAGDEGVDDQYHNKGLVAGYKFFQSLPPEKQKQLRDAAAANGWDLSKDSVQQLQRGVEPMVKDMFEKAAAAAAAKAKAKADAADMERRSQIDHYGHNM